MKIVKGLVTFAAGTMLMSVGFILLDVPADLPIWRWVIGVGFLAGSVLVWDRL